MQYPCEGGNKCNIFINCGAVQHVRNLIKCSGNKNERISVTEAPFTALRGRSNIPAAQSHCSCDWLHKMSNGSDLLVTVERRLFRLTQHKQN